MTDKHAPARVSVIIPTYNRAYCLPATLDSLVAQTHPHWEALVIDDGSTDGTDAMIAERYGHEPRVRYIHQPNKGVSHARNRGMRAATGDFISFLDSDDLCEPWKLELQVACFRRHPELGMIWTNMTAVDPTGAVVDPAFLRTMYTAYAWFPTLEELFDFSEPLGKSLPGLPPPIAACKMHSGEIFSHMMMGNLVHTSTVMLSRKCAEKVGFFREDFLRTGEDFHFHARVCREARVAYLDVSSIRYQVGMPDALTRPSLNVHCAEAFVITLEEFIRESSHLIRLPHQMLNRSRAYAHRWLGEELLMSGDVSRGRQHFIRSMKFAFSTRAAGMLAKSWLPRSAHETLKAAYRRVWSIGWAAVGVLALLHAGELRR